MSKVSMPRPRYLAFRVTAAAPVSRRAFSNALKGRARHDGWADADGPHLTRYAFPDGIVRVEHTHQTKARQLLAAITWAMEGGARVELDVRTVSASGTLKALTSRTRVLADRSEPQAS
jgi:RNase P/RNase MRP subunit POP5